MKKFTVLLTGAFVIAFFLITSFCHAQAAPYWTLTAAGSHIYNNNAGNVGIGTNSPTSSLLEVAKNMSEPKITIHNLGGNGGASFAMIDNLSGASWKFKATFFGGFKIRDHANALDVFQIEQNALANALYIKQGGNIAMGHTNPLENLHLSGALMLGGTTAGAPTAGTIDWNGSIFRGYDGGNWLNLGIQNDGDWVVGPTVGWPMAELAAGPIPATINNLPGTPNPGAWLFMNDAAAPAILPHFLALESMINGGWDVSMLFRMSNGFAPPNVDYSMGIHTFDQSFKLTNGAALPPGPTFQSDGVTLIRANSSGIIDQPNQSRVRAYQSVNDLAQLIPNAVWEPINFTMDAPLNQGWDEQSEFTRALTSQDPVPPTNAFFTATEEGYYQVNARTEFEIDPAYQLIPGAYVSIAIYIDDQSGFGFQPHAIGNNLQIALFIGPLEFTATLESNNAPNVADQVYLAPGHRLAIYVWQNSGMVLPIRPGNSVTYVSIHKES